MRWLGLLLGLAALAACQPGKASFDYWVLALSWSPEYCASDEARPGSRQCAQPRGFVVHGLWPQFESGRRESCDTRTRVSEQTARRLAPLMPDRGLVFHEWKKHGSCTGQTPEAYFANLEQAARAIHIPTAYLEGAATRRVLRVDLERAFIAANPGLAENAITFECSRQFLREVRICLDPDLKPRACGRDVDEHCGRELSVRPLEK